MIKADLLIIGASEVVTCDESLGEVGTGRIERGAVAVAGETIIWVGPQSELRDNVSINPDALLIDANGTAVIPGFVDAHTHMVFGGTRREEFAARAEGQPYDTGGILQTVDATRRASREELLNATMTRGRVMLAHGTTTAEAKSGYALDAEGELRLLEILGEVHTKGTLDLEITFLGAHALPPEYHSTDDFVGAFAEMLEVCAPAARWCDVFCDFGAFTPEQAAAILKAGKELGLIPRIHANELGPSGGTDVAVSVGAASADHLLHLTPLQARNLARAGCVGVLCPTTALGLGRFPDARMMRAEGMTIALASDLNPGTAYGENLQFAIAIATRAMGMGPSEALMASTRGAAASLRRDDIGRIAPGCLADIVVLGTDNHLDLGYHAGVNLVTSVIKRGRLCDFK